jgi:hypothetical protein
MMQRARIKRIEGLLHKKQGPDMGAHIDTALGAFGHVMKIPPNELVPGEPQMSRWELTHYYGFVMGSLRAGDESTVCLSKDDRKALVLRKAHVESLLAIEIGRGDSEYQYCIRLQTDLVAQSIKGMTQRQQRMKNSRA